VIPSSIWLKRLAEARFSQCVAYGNGRKYAIVTQLVL
jgi:hypothetical protein